MATPDLRQKPLTSERRIRFTVVALVLLAALTGTVATGGLWAFDVHRMGTQHIDEITGLKLEIGAARVLAVTQSALNEIERISGDPSLRQACLPLALATDPGGADGSAVADALRALLADSRHFDGAFVLTPGAELVRAGGSGAPFRDLMGTIDPGSGIEAGLGSVMHAVASRKALAQVGEPSIRTLKIEAAMPGIVVSDAIRDPNGAVLATLHGHLRREVVSNALVGVQREGGAELWLTDADDEVIASSDWRGDAVPTPEREGADLLTEQFATLTEGLTERWALPIESLGWGLVMDESSILRVAPVVQAIALSLGITVALGIVFGLLALGSATRIARPLWLLADGLRHLARGEEAALDASKARGEPGSLIRGFNLVVQKQRERREQLERESQALRDQNHGFQAQHENLAKLSTTDALTMLPNRRSFENDLGREIKRVSRHGEDLCLLIIDIDDFKKLNDQYGHAAGDEFLKQVSRILKESVRETDLLARFGGEEFVIVCTATQMDGAVVLAEKVRTSVAEASFIVDETKRPRRATISVGVSRYRGSKTDFFNSADAALYEAKAAGKNCVVVARSDSEAATS